MIAVISPQALQHPNEIYDFFVSYQSHISEFRFNLLDDFPDNGELSYIRSEQSFYDFLKTLLNRIETTPSENQILNIKNFSYFYERLTATPEPSLTTTAGYMSQPLRAFNIERNGDISTFYAGVTQDECPNIYGDGKGLVIGNLNEDSLDDIVTSRKRFGRFDVSETPECRVQIKAFTDALIDHIN